MSTHPIPSPAGDLGDSVRWDRLEEVRRLCRIYLREPSDVTDDGTTLTLVFTPNLTGPQTTTLNRLIALSGVMRITPQEWANIEGDITTVKAFVAIPTPTLVQNSAATKAIIRILAALLRS